MMQYMEVLSLPVIVEADPNIVSYLTGGKLHTPSHSHKHLNTSIDTSTHTQRQTKTEAANSRKCVS